MTNMQTNIHTHITHAHTHIHRHIEDIFTPNTEANSNLFFPQCMCHAAVTPRLWAVAEDFKALRVGAVRGAETGMACLALCRPLWTLVVSVLRFFNEHLLCQ